MPSIKDVAKLAGVSIATVSRVVNNLDVVSEETRRKIEWAVKRLGYNPNLAARSLKRQSAKLLGLLVPDIENPFYATLAKHMEAEASSAGYSLILCNTEGKTTSEDHYMKLLSGRLVDGVFVCRSSIKDTVLPGTGGKKLRMLILEKASESDLRQTVMVDNDMVGRLAARLFIENGHTRLACIMENREMLPFIRRSKAFVEEAAAHGIKVPPSSVLVAGPSISDGREAVRKLLRKGKKNRPTAVYCTNDILAFGAMQEAMADGLSIPRDLSVIGTDDVRQSSYMFPPLTTIRQPFEEIAKKALKILLAGDDESTGDVILAPELKVRESTGPAPI